MMPAIWPAALLGAGFWAGLLGPAASVEGAAAGLGALLANEGSCLASIHFTALHLEPRERCLLHATRKLVPAGPGVQAG